MIRLGLIGAGRWGRNIARSLEGLDGIQLTRLASRRPESRALAGPDCIVSTDWREVTGASDLDEYVNHFICSVANKKLHLTGVLGLDPRIGRPLRDGEQQPGPACVSCERSLPGGRSGGGGNHRGWHRAETTASAPV